MTDLTKLSLDELAKEMGDRTPGAVSRGQYEAEFNRRAIVAQVETLEVQRMAAQAQLDAARATQKTAKWTMWSVIAVAISVVVSVLVHFG